MINLDKLPSNILRISSVNELMDRYLQWNGIIEALDAIRAAEAK